MASLKWESELMRNQKHAQLLSPESSFDVIQTPTGAAYLSISTDHSFYVTREVLASNTGWQRLNQSDSLTQHAGQDASKVKLFATSQNPETLDFDVALVITSAAGVDSLYLSPDNKAESLSSASWPGLIWTPVPFDAEGIQLPSGGLRIADVFLMLIPADSGSAKAYFVDMEREPGNALRLLDRYYISPTPATGSLHWNRHKLAIDLQAGSVSSYVGRRSHDRVAGVYTFGMISKIQQLIFAPQYNVYRRDIAPASARLLLPAGTTSVTPCLDADGSTNLFVAAREGIFVFAADNQGDFANPALIINDDPDTEILRSVRRLSAFSMGGRTTLCALNAQSDLVVTSCATGSESMSSAWTPPMAVLTEVENFSFYVGAARTNIVLFAQVSGQDIVQLTEDTGTSCWAARRIALPPLSIDNVHEFHSFTTQINITDEDGGAMPETIVSIKAVTAGAVYINNKYYAPSPDAPLLVSSDAAGSIIIIQETENLEAISFKVAIPDKPATETLVSPAAKMLSKLSGIKTGDDLAGIQIPTGHGSETKPLLTSDISAEARDDIATAMARLLEIHQSLPDDGSVQPTKLRSRRLQATPVAVPEEPEDDNSWGISFEHGALRYHEGDHAAHFLTHSKPGHVLGESQSPVHLGDIGSYIKAKAGAFFRWARHLVDSIKDVLFKAIDGVWHFVCRIAQKTYAVVLDCWHAVAGAFEFVFRQISIFFQDVVAWLGFIFNWDDILRTHLVMKNIFVQYGNSLVSQIDNMEEKMDKAFTAIEGKMSTWAAMSETGAGADPISKHQKKAANAPNRNLPQAHWAVNHAANGLGSAETSYTPQQSGLLADLERQVDVIIGLVKNEAEAVQKAALQLKEEVVDNFGKLSPVQALKKILAIAGILITKTARNVLLGLVDLVKFVLDGFLKLLHAPIKIPILSKLYYTVTKGCELSVIDLFCLIAAIPVTVVHKLLCGGRTPFPDNAQVQAIIKAKTWGDLQTAVVTPAALKQPNGHRVHAGHDVVDGTLKGDGLVSKSILTTIQASANIAAPLAALVVVVLDSEMARNANVGSMAAFAVGAQLVLILPNIVAALGLEKPPLLLKKDSWALPMNTAVTALAVVKVAVDASAIGKREEYDGVASKVLECLLQLVWFAPSVGFIMDAVELTPEEKAEGEKEVQPSDWVSLLGAICCVVEGACYALLVKNSPPVLKAVGKVGYKAALMSYGGCSFLYGTLLLSGH